MSNGVTQFTGSIPENYDRGLGPHLFAGYADDLARRTAEAKPERVLELAAGTGILTRRLRDVLPAATSLLATDLNPPMLEVAKAKFKGGEAVTFEAVDATNLPYPDQSFDAVACQFGVMFFPEKERSYREVFRVLRPGGTYLFNVWDDFAFNPFARIASDTIGGFFESDPPGFYRTPFGYFAIDPVKAALTAAGFAGLSIEVVSRTQEMANARAFAEGLVLGNPVVEEIKGRGTARVEDAITAVVEALRRAFGEPGVMPLQAIVYRARKAP